MITQQKDAVILNRIANHPDVAPWIRGVYVGDMDFTEAVQDPRNITLMGEHGGVMFAGLQPGLYEAHTQVVPEGRGQWTLDTVNECLKWMFTKTDAVEILTRVPKGNLGARALVKLIHGTLEFRNPKGWVVDHQEVWADIYSLTIQNWMKTAPGLEAKGHWFHERLEEEYKNLGASIPQHEDDDTHDRYVGAAVEMMLAGNAGKAMVFYNRWAVMAGYAPIEIINSDPLVVNIRDAIIRVKHDDFWVMKCLQAH